SAMKLVGDDLPALSFKLPGLPEVIEAQAQLVWMSESKKEAGVRFERLLEADVRKISDWISAQRGLHAQLQQAATALPPAAFKDRQEAKRRSPAPPGREGPTPQQRGFGPIPRAESKRPYMEQELLPPVVGMPPKRKLGVSLAVFAAIALIAFVAG